MRVASRNCCVSWVVRRVRLMESFGLLDAHREPKPLGRSGETVEQLLDVSLCMCHESAVVRKQQIADQHSADLCLRLESANVERVVCGSGHVSRGHGR